MESTDPNEWLKDDNAERKHKDMFRKLLKFIADYLRKRNVPHYFISSVNLIDSIEKKEDQVTLEEVALFLEKKW